MQEEATEKFVDVERQRPHLAPMAVVLPPKRHGVVGHRDEPVVEDGDTVGVPREIVQDVGGAAKGRLSVDDPRLAIQRSQEGAKGCVDLQPFQGAWEIEAAVAKCVSDAGDELATKQLAENRNRQEETWARVDPPRAVRRYAPIGTTQWTCGWCCNRWPHVWSTMSPPIAAPSRLGFAATWRSVAAAA